MTCPSSFTPDLAHSLSEPLDINGSITPLSIHPPLFSLSAAYQSHHQPALSTCIETPPSHPRSGIFDPASVSWAPEPQDETELRIQIMSKMTAEDDLLLRLKDEENLTWKEIATRFQTDMNKTFQIPALQMRLKRLRERMQVWTDRDVQALKMAHEYWVNQRFEIIAAKVCWLLLILSPLRTKPRQMSDFGATLKWFPSEVMEFAPKIPVVNGDSKSTCLNE